MLILDKVLTKRERDIGGLFTRLKQSRFMMIWLNFDFVRRARKL